MGRDFADICDNVCKAVDFKKLVKEKNRFVLSLVHGKKYGFHSCWLKRLPL